MKVHARNLDSSKQLVKKDLSQTLEISCSNAEMDIYANRRRWLAHWIEKEYGGNKAKAAESTGYSRSQISQFLSDTYQEGRSPQERAARTIEKRFGKPERLMDTPFSSAGTGIATADETVKVHGDLPDYLVESVRSLFRAHKAGAPREVFDAVSAIFSMLAENQVASKHPEKSEREPASHVVVANFDELMAIAMREEEIGRHDLATRGEVHSEPREVRGRKGKGARH